MKNKLKIKLNKTTLEIILVVLVGIVTIAALVSYYKRSAEKSKAAGETVSLSFNPSTARAGANEDFSATIKSQPSVDFSTTGYVINFNFDASKVSVKNIEYRMGVMSEGLGDDNTKLTDINQKGSVKLMGEIRSSSGQVMQASQAVEVAVVTFTSKVANNDPSAISFGNAEFWKINTDTSLSKITGASAENLNVNGVVPQSPTPTNRPNATNTPVPQSTNTPVPTNPFQPTNTPFVSQKETNCIHSGGTVVTDTCCLSVQEFPNTCLTGACGCSLENSHSVKSCDCPEGECFNGTSCTADNFHPTVTTIPGEPTLTPVPPTATSAPEEPTPTQTHEPTPTAVGPTETPVPIHNLHIINMKLKFQGIQTMPVGDLNSMDVRVYVSREGYQSEPVTGNFTSDSHGIWSGQVTLVDIPQGDNYNFFVKGPKHLQKKICSASPVETYPGTYHCENGRISINENTNNFDFSGIYQLVGDLPAQDGYVDAYDISLVANNLNKTDLATLRLADINLDGIVDSQDYSLIIAALSTRSDEGEFVGGGGNLSPLTSAPTAVVPSPTSIPEGGSQSTGDLLRDNSMYPVYARLNFISSCINLVTPVDSMTLSLLGASTTHSDVALDSHITGILRIGDVNINDFLAEDVHRGDGNVNFGQGANLGVIIPNRLDYGQNLNNINTGMTWCPYENGCITTPSEIEEKKFILLDYASIPVSSEAISCQ